MELIFESLTTKTWQDFETLFGAQGGYSNCWCMYWRLTRREFNLGCSSGNNKAAMKALVEQGIIPGIIAYRKGQPVGWVSIAPREQFSSLERSPTLNRLDSQTVWSMVCFFASKNMRGGLLGELIEGVVAYARQQGASIVEAYPNLSHNTSHPVSRYMGTLKAFLAAGFLQEGQGGTKAILRKYL